MAKLKLISLNIERHKHLDRVEKFLVEQQPDVACFQEIFERHVERLASAFGENSYIFEPMGKHTEEPHSGIIGIAIASKFPIRTEDGRYYVGAPGALLDTYHGQPSSFNSTNRMVLVGEIEKDGHTYKIATTHFTWTPDGNADMLQRRDVQGLLAALEEVGEFVLIGDFNAPRGGEIFTMLAAKYNDNIPPHFKTSLDISLHRAGKTRPEELTDKMVDGLFSTPAYFVSDVRLIPGVSDHCAIVALVSTKEN